MAKLAPFNSSVSRSLELVGKNSEAIVAGDLVTYGANGVEKATTGEEIMGIASQTKTFASDNQTVGLLTLKFTELDRYSRVVLTADATITYADVFSYFLLNSDQTVDVATKTTAPFVVDTQAGSATDPVLLNAQVRLIKLIDSTHGVFEVVRKS